LSCARAALRIAVKALANWLALVPVAQDIAPPLARSCARSNRSSRVS